MELVFGRRQLGSTLGAFSFQASRLLLYATFFLSVSRWAPLAPSLAFLRDAGLARRWPIWLSAGLAAYALRLAVIIALILR